MRPFIINCIDNPADLINILDRLCFVNKESSARGSDSPVRALVHVVGALRQFSILRMQAWDPGWRRTAPVTREPVIRLLFIFV